MNYFTEIIATNTTDRNPDPKHFQMHIHNDYEIFCFLSGDTNYIVEGSVYPLHKGDFILIRSAEAHRIQLLSSATYRRIVINFLPAKPLDPFAETLLTSFRIVHFAN